MLLNIIAVLAFFGFMLYTPTIGAHMFTEQARASVAQIFIWACFATIIFTRFLLA